MKSINFRRFIRPVLAIVVIYIVFLLGPIAGLDPPAVAATVRADPKQLLQFFIVGLANGSIIAIIALGYTMVYGIIQLINFAHGDVYMIGVFTSLTVISITGTMDSQDPIHVILGIMVA